MARKTAASSGGQAGRNGKKAELVQALAQYGLTVKDIAVVTGEDENTIISVYSGELSRGRSMSKAAIGKALFEHARSGDARAVAQWLRWKETQE